LSPLDFNQKQEDVLAKTESNTGQWLLDNENYKIWGNGASGTWWCHGIRKGNPLCPILFAFPWTDVTWWPLQLDLAKQSWMFVQYPFICRFAVNDSQCIGQLWSIIYVEVDRRNQTICLTNRTFRCWPEWLIRRRGWRLVIRPLT